MSRRSLEAYTKGFQEGPLAGRVDMKFFECDVNEFSREQLLATLQFCSEEMQRLHKDNKAQQEFCDCVLRGAVS